MSGRRRRQAAAVGLAVVLAAPLAVGQGDAADETWVPFATQRAKGGAVCQNTPGDLHCFALQCGTGRGVEFAVLFTGRTYHTPQPVPVKVDGRQVALLTLMPVKPANELAARYDPIAHGRLLGALRSGAALSVELPQRTHTFALTGASEVLSHALSTCADEIGKEPAAPQVSAAPSAADFALSFTPLSGRDAVAAPAPPAPAPTPAPAPAPRAQPPTAAPAPGELAFSSPHSRWLRRWLITFYGREFVTTTGGNIDWANPPFQVATADIDGAPGNPAIFVVWRHLLYCGAALCPIDVWHWDQAVDDYRKVGEFLGHGIGLAPTRFGGMQDLWLDNARARWDGRRYMVGVDARRPR